MIRTSELIAIDPEKQPSIRATLDRSITFDEDDYTFLLDAENTLRHVECDTSADRNVVKRLIHFVRDVRTIAGARC